MRSDINTQDFFFLWKQSLDSLKPINIVIPSAYHLIIDETSSILHNRSSIFGSVTNRWRNDELREYDHRDTFSRNRPNMTKFLAIAMHLSSVFNPFTFLLTGRS